MITRRILRRSCLDWDAHVAERLCEIEQHFPDCSHGLNLNKSGFVKREVMRADECICMEEDGKVRGFAFLITSKRPSSLYITLMASFKRGMGTRLLHLLDTALVYPHEFTCLRTPSSSVGFYVKYGYVLFNFLSLNHYVHGNTDPDLTRRLLKAAALSTANESNAQMADILQLLITREWMPAASEEFPLLKRRSIPDGNIRRSDRIALLT